MILIATLPSYRGSPMIPAPCGSLIQRPVGLLHDLREICHGGGGI